MDEVHLPRPGHADLAGVQKYGFTDVRNVLERASARETAARVAAGALAKAFLAGARRERAEPRDADRIGGRTRAGGAVAGGLRGRGRVAGALPRRGGERGDGGRDRLGPQGERVARRSVRGARVRSRARARLARVLGGAPRRPAGAGDHVDPVDEGRGNRRRVRPRGARGVARPTTRSSGPRSAATTARPTAPAAWRAA